MLPKQNSKVAVIDGITLEKKISLALKDHYQQAQGKEKHLFFFLTRQKIISFINEMILKFSMKTASTLIEN